MTRVQIIEQDGIPAFAVVPMDIWLKVRDRVEDQEDVILFDMAKREDDGFHIPANVLKGELAGENPIKLWREQRLFTLETLAAAAGISKAYLSQIENGKRTGTLRVIKALAKKMEVPVDLLVSNEKMKLAA